MTLIEFIGLGLLVAVVLLIAVVAVRRSLLSRSGGFDVSWRTELRASGAGWILGQGRYSGDVLMLFRAFSLLPLAARSLRRQSVVLGSRRDPVGTEPDLLPPSSIIIRCIDAGADLELAMSEDAITGLQSWLESAPTAFRVRPSRGDGTS